MQMPPLYSREKLLQLAVSQIRLGWRFGRNVGELKAREIPGNTPGRNVLVQHHERGRHLLWLVDLALHPRVIAKQSRLAYRRLTRRTTKSAPSALAWDSATGSPCAWRKQSDSTSLDGSGVAARRTLPSSPTSRPGRPSGLTTDSEKGRAPQLLAGARGALKARRVFFTAPLKERR